MESDYLKAGKIASDAIVLGKKLIKEGALLLDVTCAIEEEIFKHEAKLAFPVNISINHIAAHNIVLPNDSRTFTKNDIIKLDIGVHVNGFVADTAITIDLTGKNARLVKASEDALNEALKIIKPGTSVNEIGKVIH